MIAVGIFGLLVLLQVIVRSQKPVKKALGGMVNGLLALIAVNLTGAYTGVVLPLSLLTLSVSAVAGIPGVTMLLLLNRIL